jgi:hypothetical protein
MVSTAPVPWGLQVTLVSLTLQTIVNTTFASMEGTVLTWETILHVSVHLDSQGSFVNLELMNV